MDKVFKRVCDWNAARYAREYNNDLSMDLLREEYTEWLDANTETDELDALCDLVYVAMGMLWKQDLDLLTPEFKAVNEDMAPVIDVMTNPVYLLSIALDKEPYLTLEETDLAYEVIGCSVAQMLVMGLNQEQILKAMHIVCDSNDSKSVSKTPANIKANTTKGEFYKPPTLKLQELLKCRSNQH